MQNEHDAFMGSWYGEHATTNVSIKDFKILNQHNPVFYEYLDAETGKLVRRFVGMASLDYYNGQSLAGVEMYGEEDWQWALRLSGSALVKNWDETKTEKPSEDAVGMGLLLTTYDSDLTIMKFGNVDPATQQVSASVEIEFTPAQYSITDSVYAIQEEFPQRQVDQVAENAETVYPEELVDREQEGPENQEEAVDAPEESSKG